MRLPFPRNQNVCVRFFYRRDKQKPEVKQARDRIYYPALL